MVDQSFEPFQKRRRKKVSGMTQPVSDILAVVGQTLNLDKKAQEWSVLSLWEQVVDPQFKGKTKALRLKSFAQKKIMVIQAQNHSVAAELTFFAEDYRQRMNAFTPQTGITVSQIEVRIQ